MTITLVSVLHDPLIWELLPPLQIQSRQVQVQNRQTGQPGQIEVATMICTKVEVSNGFLRLQLQPEAENLSPVAVLVRPELVHSMVEIGDDRNPFGFAPKQ